MSAIHTRVNRVHDEDGRPIMTAGELVKILSKVPENTPILYQRVRDVCFDQHGWKPISMPWEGAERDDFVVAFSAYVARDAQGGLAVCIHAHY